MIAEGIAFAYREIGVRVPVVVRLRGTAERAAARTVSEVFLWGGFEEGRGGVRLEKLC